MIGSIRVRLEAGSGALVAFVVGLAIGIVVVTVAAPGGEETSARTGPGATVAAASGPGAAPLSGAPSGEGAAAAPGTAATAGGFPAPGGAAGAGGGTVPRGAGGTGPSAVRVRGVTDRTIRIGIAWPDLSVLRYLGPSFDNGNPEEQWRAVYDSWKRKGLLPVNGRSVELVFTKYNALDPADQRAACVRLVDDQRVFMVVGMLFFAAGSECVAVEKRTTLITADGPTDEVFARGHPYLFSLSASESRHLRNFVHWAHRKGFLKGKRIGLYYWNARNVVDTINRSVKGELARLGYEITEDVQTDQERGGPGDAVAVQRFKNADVNLAMLFHSKTGFMQQADAQNYKPKYIDSDYYFGTSDTATSTYPAAHFDGTYAMTGRRVGETTAGMRLDAEQQACISNFERFTGKKLQQESTEWGYVMYACDEGKLLMHALQTAGRTLTVQSFIGALETVRNMSMSRYSPVTFTPAKHHGGEHQRTLRWSADVRRWKAVSRFEPLFVP